MDDIELDDQIDDDYIEDSSYQACYIFRSTTKRDTPSEQPNKRLKRSHDLSTCPQWPGLSTLDDSRVLTERRKSLLDSVLLQQDAPGHGDGFDEGTASNLLSFIEVSGASTNDTRLPTALLLTGLDKSNAESVLQAVSGELATSKSCIFVSLQSRQCPNLQNALKNLIKTAIIQQSDVATYNEFLARNKKFHPLNFDLELLEMFISEHNIKKIVVSLSDVEDVEVSTVNDLVNSLQLWRTQVPSILLLGVTSTRQLFEHRLSKSCLKLLNARTFDFMPCADQDSDRLRIVQTSSDEHDAKHRVFLGPNAIKTIRDLNQGQGNNAQSLKANLRYLALSHFVADPISVLADTDSLLQDGGDNGMLASIARSTASFKQFCESMIADNATASSRLNSILNNDDAALAEIQKGIEDGMNTYTSVSRLIYNFSNLYQELSKYVPKMKQPRLEVELQLYQTMNDLTNCQAFDDVRDGIGSLGHRQLKEVLSACESSVIQGLSLQGLLETLTSEDVGTIASPLQSNAPNGIHAKPLPAKSPKGKSSKTARSPAKASKQEAKHLSPVAEELMSRLDRKLQVSSLDISSLLLHEAYVLSTRTIHLKQNFDVQARTAVERALLKPGDYLTCDCCSDHRHVDKDDESDMGEVASQDNAFKNSMPPACMLFTLLQEAPTIINVRDLFDAFSSHLDQTVSNESIAKEAETNLLRRTMTLFYRALAELKMIGLIKASTGTQVKKRTAGGRANKAATQDVDFVAKTSWAGS